MASDNPKNVTVWGRLSYPTLTYAQAVINNDNNPNVKQRRNPGEERPDFSLLLDAVQTNKLVTHLKEVFLPYCVQQEADGQRKDALSQKDADRLAEAIDEAVAGDEPSLVTLVRPLTDKTQALDPDAVTSVKLFGTNGQDMVLKAVVKTEKELAVPDGDLVIPKRGLILPMNDTTHTMYAGAICAATIGLYAYKTGPASMGVSGGASVLIFKEDADPFGGGGIVDEDDILG